MKRLGFMFPGQGSQYVGMGKELYAPYPEIKDTLDIANNLAGFNLTEVMFNGPLETLTQTQYTQPSLFSFSVAVFRLLKARGYAPLVVAGHSLGEYAGLVASGVVSFEDGFKIVKIRGELLRKAAEKNKGTMAAIIGLQNNVVEEICRSVSTGVVEPVNYNCPGQLVIAGAYQAVQDAVKLCQEKGAQRAIMLNVSGAFHSSLMKEAGYELGKALNNFSMKNPSIPIVANYHALFLQNDEEVRVAMVKQVSSPVLWEKSVQQMISNGVEVMVEIGAGKVLSGLMKRIDKKIPTYPIEDEKSLQKFLSEMKRLTSNV